MLITSDRSSDNFGALSRHPKKPRCELSHRYPCPSPIAHDGTRFAAAPLLWRIPTLSPNTWQQSSCISPDVNYLLIAPPITLVHFPDIRKSPDASSPIVTHVHRPLLMMELGLLQHLCYGGGGEDLLAQHNLACNDLAGWKQPCIYITWHSDSLKSDSMEIPFVFINAHWDQLAV
ncbi:hypothetical protein CEXT_221281 [Caerostris extrusa]|uniref:Uncharacterized protein n=1 Tax=Caerostris extrusa TaxID=172846 RepID=A0AAV4W0B9_CAEEX|nr:hypothetical protein CEXT_221281 [Caerostris extrusa]